jgi:hypothetical protein
MIPSEDLFQLIKGMNMSEKRYFKVQSAKSTSGRNNNYLKLFDSISSQEYYDEKELKAMLSKENFIRHLPSEKNYLYDSILSSLNSYYKDKTFLSRYCSTLTSIEILYNKGLFSQCKKLIRKAKKEAYSLDKFAVLLIIIRWEIVISIKDEDEQELFKNFDEEMRIIRTMQVQAAFMKLAFDLQIRIDKGKTSEEYISDTEQKIESMYPRDESINSFWARYYYYSIRGLICSVRNDAKERNLAYRKIKEVMDDAPQFIRDLPTIYHLNYNNLITGMLFERNFAEASRLIATQKRFPADYRITNQTLQKIVFLNAHENELYMHYKTGNAAQGQALVRSIEAEVKKIRPDFSPVLYELLFFMAVADQMAGNYSLALKWLNKILNAQHAIYFRKELRMNTHLLYLIVLYQNNDWLFENRWKSTKKLLTAEPQFRMQQSVLECIRILAEDKPVAKNKQELKSHLALIKKEIKNSNDEKLYKTFDFIQWIEAEAKGKEFSI